MYGSTGGGPVVHDLGAHRLRLLAREIAALGLFGDDQVDHMLAVVGATLEDLPRTQRRKRFQLVQGDVTLAVRQPSITC